MIQQLHYEVFTQRIQKKIALNGTCTLMLIAALATITKLWKEPKCLSTDKWIEKMWCIYPIEYFSAVKKNEILPFATMWMELECIMLSKII